MLGPVNQVLDIIVVGYIIEKLVWRSREKKLALDGSGLAFQEMLFPDLCGLDAPEIVQLLAVGNIGGVVSPWLARLDFALGTK